MRPHLAIAFLGSLLCALFFASPARTGGFVVYAPLAFGSPLPEGMRVLPGHRTYTTESTWDGETRINTSFIGEIVNETGRDVEHVELVFRLYNGTDLVRKFIKVAALYYLPASETSCFVAGFPRDEAPTWDSYEVAIAGFELARHRLASPSIRVERAKYFDEHYVVEGTIENDSGHDINNVHYVGTLYDASGQVLGCASNNERIGPMPAGSIEDYAYWFERPDHAGAVSFKAQVVGYIE